MIRSGLELAEAFRHRTLDPVDVAEDCYERIRNYPDTSVFISLTRERALAEAKRSSLRYARNEPLSALDGVPVSWKDLIDIAGTITTAGSETRREAAAALEDAPIVKRADSAGLVCIGKVNLSEFAYSAVGYNPHFGTPRNVHDAILHRIPGGSSSGSAVSVGAGLVPISIATDTGGSVRIPAALNGVVGFKTSEGQIEKTGVYALSPTLDTIGPIATSVADCLAVKAILSGRKTKEAERPDQRPIKLVVPNHHILDGAEPDVKTAFEETLSHLQGRGVEVVKTRVSAVTRAIQLLARHGSLNAIEAFHTHRQLVMSADAAKIDNLVLRRILEARDASAYDLLEITKTRAELSLEFELELGESLLAMPTVRHVAPVLSGLVDDFELLRYVNAKTSANTVIVNLLRGCSITIPMKVQLGSLPSGLMLSTSWGRDDELGLQAARIEHMLHRTENTEDKLRGVK